MGSEQKGASAEGRTSFRKIPLNGDLFGFYYGGGPLFEGTESAETWNDFRTELSGDLTRGISPVHIAVKLAGRDAAIARFPVFLWSNSGKAQNCRESSGPSARTTTAAGCFSRYSARRLRCDQAAS